MAIAPGIFMINEATGQRVQQGMNTKLAAFKINCADMTYKRKTIPLNAGCTINWKVEFWEAWIPEPQFKQLQEALLKRGIEMHPEGFVEDPAKIARLRSQFGITESKAPRTNRGRPRKAINRESGAAD